jgi:class 3 adenylate cyclase/HAMP domain-containing protein
MEVEHSQVPILEIAHVLFIDIVAYSTLPVDKQRRAIRSLQNAITATSDYGRFLQHDQLIVLPTGDGAALVYFRDVEAPVRCAIELAARLQGEAQVPVRMGIHTGPVYRMADINANRNVTGGGINMAQRVMDMGDAGHILVSQTVAEMLAEVSTWHERLHDLGEAEVKHGGRVHLFNLYTDTAGNPSIPTRLSSASRRQPATGSQPRPGKRPSPRSSMRLLTKFNLVLIVFFGAGGLIIAKLADGFLMQNAREQVVQQAELMMASARSTRDYTSEQIKPLLLNNPEHKTNFLPQTVPAFAATTVFSKMRKNYPNYSYREATLNPTNLIDRADDWESDVIRHFSDHPNDKSMVGERETPTDRQLFLARPIAVEPSCMECHSTPDVAPAAMVKKYGADNGFGWKLDQVIAAQIVSVPMSVPISVADQAFRRLVFFLIATFVVTIIALDSALYWLVIRPLRKVSAAADRISKGETDLPELDVHGRDEIADVTASFNRMHVSLAKALKMLEG